MNNYVLLYYINNPEDERFFTKSFEKEFEYAKPVKDEHFKYYAFSGGNISEVTDKVNGILGRIGIDSKEYVALYYTRENNPNIKREMLIGKESFMTGKMNNVPPVEHERTLTDLFSMLEGERK